MFVALQSNPIMIRVVEDAPVESTSVADVLIGAIGLTGFLIVVAVLAGALFGGVLIGIKKVRERSGREPIPDSEALKIT
jgi:hypothetical protein